MVWIWQWQRSLDVVWLLHIVDNNITVNCLWLIGRFLFLFYLSLSKDRYFVSLVQQLIIDLVVWLLLLSEIALYNVQSLVTWGVLSVDRYFISSVQQLIIDLVVRLPFLLTGNCFPMLNSLSIDSFILTVYLESYSESTLLCDIRVDYFIDRPFLPSPIALTLKQVVFTVISMLKLLPSSLIQTGSTGYFLWQYYAISYSHRLYSKILKLCHALY